jgi:arylsulfatase A-like enzyme
MTLPKSVEGTSLAGIIGGKSQKVRDAFFGAYIHPARGGHAYTQHSACDGLWKLIRYDVKGKMTLQLFDLTTDPTESRDLAQDGVAQKHLPGLRELLDHSQKMFEEPRELIV